MFENCVVVVPFDLVMRYQHFIGTWYLSLPVILDDCGTSPSNVTKNISESLKAFCCLSRSFKCNFSNASVR